MNVASAPNTPHPALQPVYVATHFQRRTNIIKFIKKLFRKDPIVRTPTLKDIAIYHWSYDVAMGEIRFLKRSQQKDPPEYLPDAREIDDPAPMTAIVKERIVPIPLNSSLRYIARYYNYTTIQKMVSFVVRHQNELKAQTRENK